MGATSSTSAATTTSACRRTAEGQAGIRVQVSAQHTLEQLDEALAAFAQARREMAI
jgi:7-keto-8-aminopelargonate synthetase-like enzyme